MKVQFCVHHCFSPDIMLSQFKMDNVCISAVQVFNRKESTVWYGNLGHYCGVAWFLSEGLLIVLLPRLVPATGEAPRRHHTAITVYRDQTSREPLTG